MLRHQCKGYALNDTQTCIERETYRLSEIITDSWLENPETPSLQKHSLMREEYWTEDFTLTWPGMCFTLNTIEERGMNNLIHLFLNVNLTFIVFIHDPSYFLYTYNPQAIPMTMWIIPPSRTFHSLSLVEREHKELDVPDDHCEDDLEYKFSACIKRSLARRIGCRTRWDRWTPCNYSTCATLDQFR